MNIKALNTELALKYKTEITRFYFDNVRSNQFHEHYTWEEAKAKIDGFIDHLKNNECIAFGAFENDEMIGLVWAYEHPFREESRMYVNEIRVQEEYRYKGIGRKLMDAVEAKAKEMKINTIYLHAEANNLESRRFYKSCGYVEERIQMRKSLSIQ